MSHRGKKGDGSMDGWMHGLRELAEILVQTARAVNSGYSDLSLDDSTLPHYSLYTEHHRPCPILESI